MAAKSLFDVYEDVNVSTLIRQKGPITVVMLPLLHLLLLVGPSICSPLLQTVLEDKRLDFKAQQHPRLSGLPVSNATRSYWLHHDPDANPLAKHGSEGELTSDADVCIVGAGITGVSAAYHLGRRFGSRHGSSESEEEDGFDGGEPRKEPLSVVILEARDFCSGATGRNGGHFTPAVFLDFAQRASDFGVEEAKKFYHIEARTASELIKIIQDEDLVERVDYVSGGHVVLFQTEQAESQARTDYEAAKDAGLDMGGVEWLSREEMNSTYGTFYPGMHYGGQNLYPLKLVTALYNLTLEYQHQSRFTLALHTNTPVTSVAPSSSTSERRRWVLNTPRGELSCSNVIHATNAYAGHLLPRMRGPDGIIPSRGQVIAVRPNASLSDLTQASWSGNEGFEYWFPRPAEKDTNDTNLNGRPLVILGGGREILTRPEMDDSAVDSAVGKMLRAYLPSLFPGKYQPGKEPEMEWTGIMGFTKQHIPFVGPVVSKPREVNGSNGDLTSDFNKTLEGQFISAGYSGHGMTRSFSCAEVVADMIAADIEDREWKIPAWLPKRFLTYSY